MGTLTIPPHLERMIVESYEVGLRLVKLSAFFDTVQFQSLDLIDQNDLIEQAQHMQKYHEVLMRRMGRALAALPPAPDAA